MKRVVLLLAIMFLPFMVLAREYQVEDINLKMEIPDNYIVLTRDNLKDNAKLKELGISEDYMATIMNANNIYLDIIAEDVSYEILVVVPKIDIMLNNFSNISDKLLNESLEAMKEKTGATIGSIYKSKYNFTLVEYYDSNMKYNIVNYYTVANAKGYNFQLQKRGAITSEDKEIFKKMVDSINIKILDEYKNESAETQKMINNSTQKGFNWKRVIIGAIIGGVVGGLGSMITLFIKKKQNKTSE